MVVETHNCRSETATTNYELARRGEPLARTESRPPAEARKQGESISRTPDSSDSSLAQCYAPIAKYLRQGTAAGIETGGKLAVDFGTMLKTYWKRILGQESTNLSNGKFLAIAGMGITTLLMTLKTVFEALENIMGGEKAQDKAPLPFLIIKLVLGAGLAMTAHNTISKNGKPSSKNAISLMTWFLGFLGIDQLTHLHSKQPTLLKRVLGFCGAKKEDVTSFMDNLGLRSLMSESHIAIP